jgi:hypothetical protein
MFGKSPTRGRAMRTRSYRSSKSGISLVEFAAAVVFGLPLVMTMLYAVIEANLFFTIRTNLDLAVRQGAQKIINKWNMTRTAPSPLSVTGGELPAGCSVDIKSGDGHYFVRTGAKQFDYKWDTSNGINTIHIFVHYPTPAAAAGLNIVPFPYPDPFKVGSSFNIWSCGTFRAPD